MAFCCCSIAVDIFRFKLAFRITQKRCESVKPEEQKWTRLRLGGRLGEPARWIVVAADGQAVAHGDGSAKGGFVPPFTRVQCSRYLVIGHGGVASMLSICHLDYRK